MRRTALSLLIALVFSLFMVGVVYAAMGPHGDYRDTTNKCICCHDVHEALSSFKLLPQATVQATCDYCHNGTNGRDIYAMSTPLGAHVMTTDATRVPGTIIGGAFTNTSLTCSSCHSPHDNDTVAVFRGDTNHITQTYFAPPALPPYPTTTFYGQPGGVVVETNKLLKRNPYKQPTTTDFQFSLYGAGWCTDCHLNRHSEGTLANHPVNTATAYNTVSYWTGSAWATTRLGGSNAGYLQRATSGVTYSNYPICQQCHEDTRNVEAAFNVTTQVFSATDNPKWKNFPHETELDYFRLETGDDLCLNCHITTDLP